MENKFIKILVIEDEFTSRRILNSFLSPLGEVDIAVNGNEAITAFEKAIENNQLFESMWYPKGIVQIYIKSGTCWRCKVSNIFTRPIVIGYPLIP